MAPSISATRAALTSAITSRLSAQGILIDSSQLGALISDIEFQINVNAGTVLADVVADLGLLPAPPLGGF